MKEAKSRNLSIFLLGMILTILIMVASNSQMILAQETTPPSNSATISNAHHILLDEDDFTGIGKATTVVAPDWVIEQKGDIPAPGLLSEWSESAATTLFVQSMENELVNVIVNMSSYQFASEKNAHDQLQRTNTRLFQENVKTLDNTNILDNATMDLLTKHTTSWQIQTGIDDEDLLAYFLWIQLDNYIIESHIIIEEHNEQYGQQILHHMIQAILTKDKLNIMTTPKMENPESLKSWFTSTANSSLERSGTHFLAVWNLGSGNNQHYIGSGGDPATCGSSHGCISSWTWWMNPSYGPSKLGIPKSFLLLNTDRWNGSNYQANVWCC